MVSPTPEPGAGIRDAATLILVRNPARNPAILMGRRRRGAVFMPGKVVFPGGAVDPGDGAVPLTGDLSPECRARLAAKGGAPNRFVAAAIRELWEEAGLAWAAPGRFAAPSRDWDGLARRGLAPKATGLAYIYRAITPPGRPRRFDARFFLADAAGLATDADDFAAASGELADLRWVALPEIDGLDIAPVTRTVLGFVLPRLPDLGPPPEVPLRG
ncbi:MAG: NUDIX hydrolase [Paracoccaceae bacterium]|nr:NUDIX hydrolase [Paracoccaceae bacterium]